MSLLVFEVVVLLHVNSDKFDPSATNVLLIEAGLGLLAVITIVEENAGLSSELTVWHDTNLD